MTDAPPRPARAVIVPGALSLLVSAALLTPLPRPVVLTVVGVLVAVLVVLAVPRVRGPWRATTAGQLLWFWGVVTGLGHLLRSLVAEPAPVESVAVGAAVTLVWALGLGVLRVARR